MGLLRSNMQTRKHRCTARMLDRLKKEDFAFVKGGGFYEIFIGQCRMCGEVYKCVTMCLPGRAIDDRLIKEGAYWISPKGVRFSLTKEEVADAKAAAGTEGNPE